MRAVGVALALFALAAGDPRAARAASGERHLALELGGSGAVAGSARPAAATFGVTGWWGVADLFWALAAARGLVQPRGGAGAEAVVGVVAALDVFRTIPFVEVAGGLGLRDAALGPVLRVGVGADHHVTRTLTFGGALRYRPSLGERGGTHDVSGELRFGLRLDP